MKAVIVEIRGQYAAALADDGCVKKVKNKQYLIGQEIEMKKKSKKYSAFVGRAACVAAAALVMSTSAWAYYSPYSYVSLDVNPSIEYAVNRFDRVLNNKAVNEDGESILENLNLKNKNINEAIKATIEKIVEEGYITREEANNIMIATTSESEAKTKKLAEELKETAEETTEELDLDVELESVGAGHELKELAEGKGVSVGKMVLIQKLQASTTEDMTAELDTWLSGSVKDIMKQIKENKKLQKEQGKQEDQDEEESEESEDLDEQDSSEASSEEEKTTSNNGQDKSSSDSDNNGKSDSKDTTGNGKNSSKANNGKIKDSEDEE